MAEGSLPMSCEEAEANFERASRALTEGIHRVGGATASEWAAYDSARLGRMMARERFLLAALQFNEDAAAFLRQARNKPADQPPMTSGGSSRS